MKRISADWVWLGDAPPRPATLVIEAGRVAALEPADPRSPDHRPGLITPGLVNAHAHLDLSFARPESPSGSDAPLDRPFTDWLLGVKALRDEAGFDGLESAARAGIAESLAHGTTTVVDYDSGGFSLGPLAESPLRRWCLREVIDFRGDLERWRSELDRYLVAVSSPRERRGLAPHAPYTVVPALRRALVRFARERGVLWSMHFAEQPWEDEFLARGTGPFADFLTRIPVPLDPFALPARSIIDDGDLEHLTPPPVTPRPLLVHANHLDSTSIDRLSRLHVAVVFCPRSHAYFGHPRHPWPDLDRAGVPVCVGTDGKLSAGSLSLRAELRAIRAADPSVTAERLWRLVTRDARVILGDGASGSLAIGEPADFVVWSLPDAPSPGDPEAVATSVLERALDPKSMCLETWIDGERVFAL